MAFIADLLLILIFCGEAGGVSITQFQNRSEYLLMLHNRFRRSLTEGTPGIPTAADMMQLSWDPILQREAEHWAQCDNIGLDWNHVIYDDLGIPLRGLNSVIATRGTSLYRLVRRWYLEKAHYDFNYNMCQPGKSCNRFMQMVSGHTSRVGCTVNSGCDVSGVPVRWLVCIYSPGADESSPLFRSGAACTKCESPQSFCNQGLCVECQEDRNSQCDCRKTCRVGKVTYGELKRETCTCKCDYGNGPNCDDACANPDQYLDYDVCAGVTSEECSDPATREMMGEFCPEQCTCNKPPIPFL